MQFLKIYIDKKLLACYHKSVNRNDYYLRNISFIGGKLWGLEGVLLGGIISVLIVIYGWQAYFLFSRVQENRCSGVQEFFAFAQQHVRSSDNSLSSIRPLSPSIFLYLLLPSSTFLPLKTHYLINQLVNLSTCLLKNLFSFFDKRNSQNRKNGGAFDALSCFFARTAAPLFSC